MIQLFIVCENADPLMGLLCQVMRFEGVKIIWNGELFANRFHLMGQILFRRSGWEALKTGVGGQCELSCVFFRDARQCRCKESYRVSSFTHFFDNFETFLSSNLSLLNVLILARWNQNQLHAICFAMILQLHGIGHKSRLWLIGSIFL